MGGGSDELPPPSSTTEVPDEETLKAMPRTAYQPALTRATRVRAPEPEPDADRPPHRSSAPSADAARPNTRPRRRPTVYQTLIHPIRTAAALLAAVLLSALLTPPAHAATACTILGAAHRGNAYTGSATENSLDGFRQSWATGIRTVETDLWFTSDNVGVLMHDSTVDRTTSDGSGTVIGMSSAQFAGLHLNDGQTPPTLDQALALLRADPNRLMLLELKRYLTPAQKTILLRQLAGLESQVSVNGFKWEQQSMLDLKRADPQLKVTLWVDAASLPVPAGMQGEDLMAATTAENVAAIHAQGGTVRLFSDSPAGWSTAQAAGVNTIVTNKAYAFQRWTWKGCPTVS